MKTCAKCKLTKELAFFSRNIRHSDGLQSRCKACNKTRYDQDAEKFAMERRRFRAGNKLTISEQRRNARLKNPVSGLLIGARARSKRLGIEFSLTAQDIVIPEFCPLLPHIQLKQGRGITMPHSPTLDRIDPHGGYVAGNVHVVSHKANMAKGKTSLEELKLLGEWATKLLDKK